MPIGRLRASFFRAVGALAALAAATDFAFFRAIPPPHLATLALGQAALLGLILFFGLRHLELVRDDGGTLYGRFVLPNVLTLGRILAIPSVLAGAAHARTDPRANLGVAIVFAVATLSDLLDGWISRRFARASLLGRVLDPLADAMFYSCVSVGLWFQGTFPSWLAAVAVLRFVPSMVAGVWIFARKGPTEIAPTRLGKASSFALGVATGIVLLRVVGVGVPEVAGLAAGAVAAGLGLASVVEYVRMGLRTLRRLRA